MAVSPVIGLDIGTNTVKLAQISRSRNRLDLGFAGLAPLPDGAIVEKSIKNPDAVSNAIRALYDNSRSRIKQVCTSVAGKAVIIKQVTVASMKDHDLEKLIQIEAEPYIYRSTWTM